MSATDRLVPSAAWRGALPRLAWAAVIATYALLLVGSTVHATGSSLACPDWPLCYGQLLPEMQGGILYEHTHRMVATAVGALTLALAAAVHATRRVDLRSMSITLVALVIVQGVLGGVTVLLRLPMIVSLLHLLTSMVFFSTLVRLALAASETPGEPALAPLSGWIGVALFVTVAQILLGGFVRHTGAALACPDFPRCADGWLPPPDAQAITHYVHRAGAIATVVIGSGAAISALRRTRAGSLARWVAGASIVLLVAQFTLGVLCVLARMPLWSTTAHMGGAAALVALQTTLVVLARGRRSQLPAEEEG